MLGFEYKDHTWNKIEIYDVLGECKVFVNGVELKYDIELVDNIEKLEGKSNEKM